MSPSRHPEGLAAGRSGRRKLFAAAAAGSAAAPTRAAALRVDTSMRGRAQFFQNGSSPRLGGLRSEIEKADG